MVLHTPVELALVLGNFPPVGAPVLDKLPKSVFKEHDVSEKTTRRDRWAVYVPLLLPGVRLDERELELSVTCSGTHISLACLRKISLNYSWDGL
jgi:hypothetical protein